MISVRSFTPEEKEKSEEFERAGKVMVIKDVTVLNFNKFHTIKTGSISIEYCHCNYHFLDEKGNDCYINCQPCQENPEYFIPVTTKEIRRRKLLELDERSNC